jgi:hypothetical protein
MKCLLLGIKRKGAVIHFNYETRFLERSFEELREQVVSGKYDSREIVYNVIIDKNIIFDLICDDALRDLR